ncbi:MAG: class I SAM-dependent methyltransferase [Candidatus Bathyarchaeia archaeon]
MNEDVESVEHACPVCGAKKLSVFFQLSDVPVHCNVLWRSRESAINCPKGDIFLAFCPVCTYIMNLAFEPNRLEYTPAYENSLHFSSFFQNYARSLAKRLIKRYNLYGKDIIEIGCGKGYFLKLLCQLGKNNGVGFDPAYPEETDDALYGQVKFIKDFYSERYANYKGDLIVCRQTLEHIHDPKGFLKMLRHAIGNNENTQVFFEVPNALKTFQKLFIWDIIYEHCSYFTPTSLSQTFSSAGFHVREITEEFGGQYLCIYAEPANSSNLDYPKELSSEVDWVSLEIATFTEKFKNKVKKWREKLDMLVGNGQRVVVWGAGSKGVTFLNTFNDYQHNIEYAVDVNPLKQGMYIPGTGQKIVSPEFLKEYHPDVVIVMNPVYRREIRNFINRLGQPCKLMSA